MQLQFSKVFPDMEQDIPELPLASFSKRVLVFNLSPDCKFFIHSTYFHTNGRASGLVLKEGVKGNSEMAYCSLNPEIQINILLICYFLRNVVICASISSSKNKRLKVECNELKICRLSLVVTPHV